MKNFKKMLLMLTNGLHGSTEFGPNLEKNLLQKKLSILVRNFAPLNAPLNIFKNFLF